MRLVRKKTLDTSDKWVSVRWIGTAYGVSPAYPNQPNPTPQLTLQAVRNQLVSHFATKDTFAITDIDKIAVDPEIEDSKPDVVVAALDQLVKMGIVENVRGKLWILSNPSQSMSQELTISMHTASLVANTLETFFEANELDYEPIDALDIHEGHILTLLQVLNEILDNSSRPAKS